MFKDKILLITGGTGSFGNKMLRYFINNTDIKEVRVFSRDEEKQDRMRTELKDDRIKYYIGNVRDYKSINEALRNVDFVFHAAALKQVPSCEFYPIQAVHTNIIGSSNVIDACIENKVKKLVMLSTDKAVYPINAMGMTKAIMEKLMISKSRNLPNDGNTTLCATRYGNVMASRGSVIPLFIKQCKENKPITVTDPNMTRFLMSLDESVDLVLFAFNNAVNGDIFVQKASACTIMDLALAIKEIFNPNVEIKIIGTRHGEKTYETLINKEDMIKAVDMGNFYKIPADNRDLNYDKYFIDGNTEISSKEEYNSDNTTRLNKEQVKEKLLALDYVQSEL
ncbi:polysaccharide biosynthesis protein [Brachyspira murdochii]|uniref:UDP-glucose 4-epimerase n=1 Tax=Brachyspira murdochii (strain ATCC 51284 / DSM 12563 / 56-150) TaxID=526224 RepID=D5U4K0_BRAM5|nr:polysaccharide biosynthesis protein [Brachyspira murdochii]ADG70245.1 polysaccharide biosynthesis protein CapD [Brachyspira murdochii DSM 12563]